MIVYEPQIASWANQKQLVAFAAASYQAKGAAATAKPALGTIKLEADTACRSTNGSSISPTCGSPKSNFSTLPKEQLHEVVAEITKAIPEEDRVIALDRVLAFVDKSAIVPKDVPGLKADPPVIFFSQTPAVLVNFDGDPIWSPIEKNDLKFAVNTNWDVFEHEPTKTFYLRHNESWLKTTDLKGAWTAAGKLPAELRGASGGRELQGSQKPRCLESRCRPISGRRCTSASCRRSSSCCAARRLPARQRAKELLWVSNTESDVFRLGKTGPVYYLVTGRWFSAPDFKGPWTFATPKLPEDFKRIPSKHTNARACSPRCPAPIRRSRP